MLGDLAEFNAQVVGNYTISSINNLKFCRFTRHLLAPLILTASQYTLVEFRDTGLTCSHFVRESLSDIQKLHAGCVAT
ncbi:hypothetical protein DS648_14220 [Salmonella enterica subsp. enterica serovar Saintpaul]|nr:hypothetical protein [Salmonella enterica subsp. enterica serovar Saintpaul]